MAISRSLLLQKEKEKEVAFASTLILKVPWRPFSLVVYIKLSQSILNCSFIYIFEKYLVSLKFRI